MVNAMIVIEYCIMSTQMLIKNIGQFLKNENQLTFLLYILFVPILQLNLVLHTFAFGDFGWSHLLCHFDV